MNNKMTTNEFSDVLIDVRSAYRLLYLYQKRMLELVKVLGNKLNFFYSGGWVKFSDPCPRNGRGSLDNWPWDWLNLYAYEFNFQTKEIGKDVIDFSIILISDNGAYINEAAHNEIEKFKNVEESNSLFIFILGKNQWEDIDEIIDEVARREVNYEKCNNNNNKIMLYKSYDVKNFINEEQINNQLDNFHAFCKRCGIEINKKTI